MNSSLNYPDNLYADHLAKQTPTGAYDARHSACDPVNHPAHYQRAGIETIDYIRASLGDGFGPYCVGNVLKYVSRYRDKGGVEDLNKAQVYLRWAIDVLAPATARAVYDAQTARDVAWSVKRGDLPPNLAAAILRDAGIGDVPRHPMSAEADRIAEDRL